MNDMILDTENLKDFTLLKESYQSLKTNSVKIQSIISTHKISCVSIHQQ